MTQTQAIRATSSRQPSLTTAEKRLQEFGRAIEKIYAREVADLGQSDLEHFAKMRRISRRLEWTGRTLLFVSFEPVGFTAGVLAQWLHKQLEVAEIGHMALHGVLDKLTEEDAWKSKTFVWDFPVDEESWRYAHNARHHPFTNTAGQDPDIHFGMVRLTPETPHRWFHYVQVPTLVFFILPNFGAAINTHVTGLLDVYLGNGLDSKMDFLKDRSWSSIGQAHKRALRKWIPYYAKEYIAYPALAGPFFWKVALGNYMASTLRDVYTGLTIFCGHVGAEVKSYEKASTGPRSSRGQWYAQQVEAAQNFKVSRPFSLLCGALDYQIEHHLFPRLPPERLRKVSREVQACCEEYGVSYQTDSWPRTLGKVFKQLGRLSLART